MSIVGLTEPVVLKVIVGVVAPLLMNSSWLPVSVTVGAVPELGPTLVKLSWLSLKGTVALSLFEMMAVLAAESAGVAEDGVDTTGRCPTRPVCGRSPVRYRR